MATSAVNLPPISPTIKTGSYRNLDQTSSGFGFSKTSFGCGSNSKNNNNLFSSHSKRALSVRKLSPPSASNSFNHIPKQFREENLKDGLIDNFKSVPQSLYGLNPSQLDMFTADDGPLSIKQQAENVKLETLTSAYSYLNDGGMTSRAGMNRMREAGASMYSMAIARGGSVRRPRSAPPDLPSIFLDARIVYLGMPIYKAVSELICAEFLYLDYDDNTKPIYLYINSSGTQNANQEIIASEADAFAIADCMCATKAKVYTVNVAEATGQAAMLLALGEKGHRALQPHASTKLHMPKMFAVSGATTDMWIRAKALNVDNESYLDLLSIGIGKPKDEIAKDIRFGKYMPPKDAIAYGVADRIIFPGDDDQYEKRDHGELVAAAMARRKAKGLGPPRNPFDGARAK